MDPNLLLAFWAVAAVLIAVPGPDWAFVLATGARDRTLLPAVGGLLLGYGALTAVVAAGVGSLVARSPLLLTGLTFVGAGYLGWLGVALLRRPSSLHAEPAISAGSALARLRRGIGVSGLNPKGLLLFVAMLPQFTDRHGSWPVQAQLAALGLVFVATCGAFYVALGLGARVVLTGRPAAAQVLSRVSGAAMIVIALAVLVERVR